MQLSHQILQKKIFQNFTGLFNVHSTHMSVYRYESLLQGIETLHNLQILSVDEKGDKTLLITF